MPLAHASSGCGCGLGLTAVRHGVAVIKAKQSVPEYDDIEAIQDAMGEALMVEWSAFAEEGIASAVASLSGKATVTKAHVATAFKKMAAPFSNWPSKGAVAMINEGVGEMYRLAQQVILNKHAGTKGYDKQLVFKAKLQATFNVIDRTAQEQLRKQQVFWLRDHYDDTTRKAINYAAGEELIGMHGTAAGELLRKEAERIHGVGEFVTAGHAYFTGVAVNASTTARVSGSILEMEELGIDGYEIVNPMDERTSDICADLNGKVFPVKEGADRVRQLLAAESPDEIRALHPWSPNDYGKVFADLGVDVERDKPITPDAATVLSQAGYGMPPYHFRCRTTVDVASQGSLPPTPLKAPGASAGASAGAPAPSDATMSARERLFGEAGTAKPDRWLLTVSDSASALKAKESLEAIEQVKTAMAGIPKSIQVYSRKKGVRVYIDDNITTRWSHLKGVQPRGWRAGSTWAEVGGGANGLESVVAVGPGISGGLGHVPHTAIHEWGHNIDKLAKAKITTANRGKRFSDQSWFHTHHANAITPSKGVGGSDAMARYYRERDGWGRGEYFRQTGNAGREEWWAECVADAFGRGAAGRALLDKHFPGLVDDMAEQLVLQWKL